MGKQTPPGKGDVKQVVQNAFFDELSKISELAHMSANDLTDASVSNTPLMARSMPVRDAKTDGQALHQLAATGTSGNMRGTSAYNRVAHGF